LLQLYALALQFSTVDATSQAVLRLTDRFRWLSMAAVTLGMFELVVVTIAVLTTGDLRYVLMGLVLKSAIGACLYLGLAAVALQTQVGLRTFWSAPVSSIQHEYRALVRFVWHTNISMYLRMLNTRADVLILGFFRGPTEVGVYKLALQIASIVVRISDPFHSAILPDLSTLWAQRRLIAYRNLLRRLTLMMALLLIPLALGVILASHWLMGWLVRPNVGAANVTVAICSLAYLIAGIFFWARPAAISMQRPEFNSWAGTLSVTAQTLSAVVLVPVWGGVGSAVALVINFALVHPILLWQVRRFMAAAEVQPLPEVGHNAA